MVPLLVFGMKASQMARTRRAHILIVPDGCLRIATTHCGSYPPGLGGGCAFSDRPGGDHEERAHMEAHGVCNLARSARHQHDAQPGHADQCLKDRRHRARHHIIGVSYLQRIARQSDLGTSCASSFANTSADHAMAGPSGNSGKGRRWPETIAFVRRLTEGVLMTWAEKAGAKEQLSVGDKLVLLKPTVCRQVAYVGGLIALKTRMRRRPQHQTLPQVRLPPGRWAAEVLATAEQFLSPEFLNHSMRTWCFATVLGQIDGESIDPELMFVAAALHDVGLFQPIDGRCFTVTGARVALSTAASLGVPEERAELAARAISMHISPAVPSEILGRYLQAGSLLDVTGNRVWDVSADTVAATHARWSRTGFAAEVRALWKKESARLPHGRASYARCPGCLLLALRLNPL